MQQDEQTVLYMQDYSVFPNFSFSFSAARISSSGSSSVSGLRYEPLALSAHVKYYDGVS